MTKQRSVKQEVQTKPIYAPVDSQEAITEVLTPDLSGYAYLTESDLECLYVLPSDGAPVDVFSLKLAKGLRKLEMEQSAHNHKIIELGIPTKHYRLDEQLPYFSARLGVDGLKVVNND